MTPIWRFRRAISGRTLKKVLDAVPPLMARINHGVEMRLRKSNPQSFQAYYSARLFMPQRPPSHRAPGSRSVVERKREFDQYRASSSSRGYDSRWRKARIGWLKKNPLCAACQSIGVITAANEVDHIRPHRGDKKLFWDSANWQSLCKSCHSRKTAMEDSRFACPLPDTKCGV
jgi:5-methylcytosine-specific restriction protein A